MKKQLLKPLTLVKKLFKWAKNHKKIALPIIIILIILVIIFRPRNNVVIEAQSAKRGDLIKSLSISGSIESRNSVNLTFQTGGAVTYIGAKQGEDVYKGQAIVSLDKQKLEANFRQAEQDFTAAKAASEQYYSSHTNATESYDEKVKRTALDATQNKAYDQMVKAQKDLNDFTLYSPIEGILTRADIQNTGVNITAATIFTVTDPSFLDFKMDVDEADIGNIKIGQSVNIILDSYPNDTLTFKIDNIDFVTHTTSTGGDAYTVKAFLGEENLDYKYKVGMNGNAEIIQSKIYNVISIPISSLFDTNKAYVKLGERFEKRTLDLGLENDTDIEIKNGIKEGDRVVLDPSLVKPQAGFKFPFLGR